MCISCGLLPDTQPIKYQIVYLQNTTNKFVEVSGFYKGQKIGLETIKIEPKSDFQIWNKYPYPVEIFPNWQIDSLALTVGSSNIYSIYCNGTELNICNAEKNKFLISRFTEKPTNEKVNRKKVVMKYYFNINDADIAALK
jgi:hypothetical protein